MKIALEALLDWLHATPTVFDLLLWLNDLSPVEIPSGVSIFPREIAPLSKRWCEQRFRDLRYYHRADRGGHFAAFEQPARFVDELRAFLRTLRGAHVV